LLLPGLRQDKALCTGLPSKRVVVVNVLHRVKVKVKVKVKVRVRVRDQDLVVGALLHRLVVVLTHVRTKSSRLINSRQ
jgi:hypothetical protein